MKKRFLLSMLAAAMVFGSCWKGDGDGIKYIFDIKNHNLSEEDLYTLLSYMKDEGFPGSANIGGKNVTSNVMLELADEMAREAFEDYAKDFDKDDIDDLDLSVDPTFTWYVWRDANPLDVIDSGEEIIGEFHYPYDLED
ncbi:MAG: hypothetical protein LBU92_01295 [Prevotellaceae bacterium]|jgi:hypothetical protein|nr:hypothetical protein [Prevotellaceae bacterium]